MLVQPVTMAAASANRADVPPRPAPQTPASAAAGRQEPAAAAASVTGSPTPPSREAVHAAVEASRQALGAQGTIEFRIDESSGRTVVQVLDPATEEVLRQIPSEEMLAIANTLDRVQGLLLRQQA